LQTGIGTIAGLGYGLPMSRLYARVTRSDVARGMGNRCLSETSVLR
jgi:hypothetical protein